MYIRDMSYIFGTAVIIIRTIIKVIVDLSCEKKKHFTSYRTAPTMELRRNYGTQSKYYCTIRFQSAKKLFLLSFFKEKNP